jgi:hypothetical protein
MISMPKNKYIFMLIALAIAIPTVWYKWFRITYDQYGLQNPPVSYEFVSSRPEAKLSYPNGKILAPFGTKQERSWYSVTGYNTAFSGAVMTSQDSSGQIYKWYDDWLTQHGWHEDKIAENGMGGSQISVRDYTKEDPDFMVSRETFEVSMDNPTLLSGALGEKIDVSASTTVFEFRYMIK